MMPQTLNIGQKRRENTLFFPYFDKSLFYIEYTLKRIQIAQMNNAPVVNSEIEFTIE